MRSRRCFGTAPEASEAWRPSSNASSWSYWRREAHVYESGLPSRLGLRAPTLLGSVESPDGVELQLEALTGRTAGTLTIADLEELVLELAGSYPKATEISEPWLSRGFLRDYSTSREADFALCDDEASWGQQLVAPFVDSCLRAGFARLHANRERLLGISESLPRTVCHLDVFPNNVFADADGVALIDWAFTGDGSIGEDVGNLIPDSVFDLQFDVDELPALEERLVGAYLRGLRAAGWGGDDRVAVLGIHASAVKYDWLVPRLLAGAASPVHTQYGGAETDALALYRARWAGLALVVRWADSALAEADALGIA